jgi:rRNA maturation endonuclease Nob1
VRRTGAGSARSGALDVRRRAVVHSVAMIRLTVFALLALAAAVMTAMKRAAARRQIEEIDGGKRCIACEGTEVSVEGDVVRCAACGHRASLRALGSVRLSAQEINDMTRPDDRRL